MEKIGLSDQLSKFHMKPWWESIQFNINVALVALFSVMFSMEVSEVDCYSGQNRELNGSREQSDALVKIYTCFVFELMLVVAAAYCNYCWADRRSVAHCVQQFTTAFGRCKLDSTSTIAASRQRLQIPTEERCTMKTLAKEYWRKNLFSVACNVLQLGIGYLLFIDMLGSNWYEDRKNSCWKVKPSVYAYMAGCSILIFVQLLVTTATILKYWSYSGVELLLAMYLNAPFRQGNQNEPVFLSEYIGAEQISDAIEMIAKMKHD